MSSKTVIVLGAGAGGLVAVNALRHLLPPEHKVILVEKNPIHAFPPSFLWLMTGDRRPEAITRDLNNLVRPGIEVIISEATRIDIANREVEISDRTLTYDYLIIAIGAELAPEIIPGLTDDTPTFFTFDGAQKLHQALLSFQGGTIALVVGGLPYKCPGAPHEGAMLLADFFRKRGQRDKVDIHLFTPETQPMPTAGPMLGVALEKMLESKGIGFHPQHRLISVDSSARELHFDIEARVHYDYLVAIAPHRAPQVARVSGLTNEAGWIPVNRTTLRTRHENVFAIGDIAAVSIPGRWKAEVPLMLPKAGVFAHTEAEVVAHRIADEVGHKIPASELGGIGYCALETGEGRAGFAFGEFFGEPSPHLTMRATGRMWHWGKVLFEQWWLSPYGAKRELLRMMLKIGGKTLGIPEEQI